MPLEVFGSRHEVGAIFKANAAGFKRPKAIRFKHGVLSPGAYIDNRKLASHPDSWNSVVGAMNAYAARLKSEYDVIAAVATGGIAHAAVIAQQVNVPLVIIKKEEKGHGLDGLIDGDEEVLYHSRVMLVEDMSSTFASSLKAMRPVEQAGGKVACTLMISTWDLPDFQANTQGHQVYAVCTGETLLDHAVEGKLVDDEHERILRHWLIDPKDESWAHDGKWQPPKGETF